MLASDATYTLRLPSGAPRNEEKWTAVNEATIQAEHNHVAATNSFTGNYVRAPVSIQGLVGCPFPCH